MHKVTLFPKVGRTPSVSDSRVQAGGEKPCFHFLVKAQDGYRTEAGCSVAPFT